MAVSNVKLSETAQLQQRSAQTAAAQREDRVRQAAEEQRRPQPTERQEELQRDPIIDRLQVNVTV